MWLASASYRDEQDNIATGDWTEPQRKRAENALHNVLLRVGNPHRERLFRMNITLCLHRACTEKEKSALPHNFWQGQGGLAGGPIELLRTTGLPPRPAALPCEKPERHLIDRTRPDLWLPIDCGQCPPCVARAAIREVPAA